MPKTLRAHFDGRAFWPEEPTDIAPGTKVKITIEIAAPGKKEKRSFLETAAKLSLDGPADWSSRLEDYLYREPLNENS